MLTIHSIQDLNQTFYTHLWSTLHINLHKLIMAAFSPKLQNKVQMECHQVKPSSAY